VAKKKKKTTVRSPSSSPSSSLAGAVAAFSNGRTALFVSLFLLAAAVFFYYPNHFGDYDIFWHLKYGEHFVSGRTWHIDHTAYSWTPTNGNWKYVTWIGSSALYLIHRVAGYPGLHVFQYLTLLSLGILFYVYLRLMRSAFRVLHVAVLLLVAVAVNPTAIFIKPDSFTMVFFGVATFIYFCSKYRSRNLFYLYPVVFLVWVNTHGGFIIGLFFVTLALVLEAVDYMFVGKNGLDRRLLGGFAVSMALSYCVLAVNPYGVSYPIETAFRLVFGDKGYLEILKAYINRWQYLFPEIYVFRRTNTAWAIVLMELGLVLLFVHAYVKRRFLDTTLILLNVVFFYFSMQMARATLFFPILWMFTVPYVIRKGDLNHLNGRLAFVSVLTVVFVSGVCFQNTLMRNTYDSWFGSGLKDFVPVEEAAFIRDNALPKPLFNDYLSGGYLIWALHPDYKVFIDPRHRPYEKTGVWRDFIVFRRDLDRKAFERFTEKYPFETALVHHVNYPDIAAAFLQSPEWRIVHIGTVAAVFVRESALASLDTRGDWMDIGPEKFSRLANPTLLFSLFKVYYLIDLEKAREIVHIYRNNVSRLYGNRKRQLRMMTGLLAGGGNFR